MMRHEGHVVSEATILRLPRDEGLILPGQYQRERRKLAERRKAAFATEPTGPNQVWQLDFSEFETTTGGTWRLAGCRDYWSKYEQPFHVSPTANQHDAIDAIELALADYEAMFGHRLVDDCPVDEQTGELLPVVTVVTDNGGPFRSFRFEAFITGHPEVRHVRTRVRTPGQNGSRVRGFGALKYERLSSTRSTTPSCSPTTPRPTASCTTRSGRTKPSRGTGPGGAPGPWPTPPPHVETHNRNPCPEQHTLHENVASESPERSSRTAGDQPTQTDAFGCLPRQEATKRVSPSLTTVPGQLWAKT